MIPNAATTTIEKEEKEHDVALEAHRFEELMIHFGPRLGEYRGWRNCSNDSFTRSAP